MHQWHRIGVVVALVVLAGCAAPDTYLTFFGRYAEPIADADGAAIAARHAAPGVVTPQLARPITPNQGGDAITARGSIVAGLGRRWISIALANHGSRPLELSYVTDEYVAKTASGRTVMLEKDDFLTYPDVLNPGDERPVSLVLPRDVPAREITLLIANINNGRTVILLQPIGPIGQAAELSEAPVLVVAARPPAVTSYERTQTPASTALAVPSPAVPVVSAPPAQVSGSHPPVGTVPVTIEFEQEMGTALTAEYRWNDAAEVYRLGHGERQLFYVVPGRHELHVVSRLPGITDTRADLAVLVDAAQPIRVTLTARAQLSGVTLRVRVWRGIQVVSDQTFEAHHGDS